MTLKENNLSDNIIDISLRPEHVGAMSLEAEVVEVKRRETLERYGATDAEIEFLAPNYGDCQRVGLNAMTSADCRFCRSSTGTAWQRSCRKSRYCSNMRGTCLRPNTPPS
jgi:hypothetical protein